MLVYEKSMHKKHCSYHPNIVFITLFTRPVAIVIYETLQPTFGWSGGAMFVEMIYNMTQQTLNGSHTMRCVTPEMIRLVKACVLLECLLPSLRRRSSWVHLDASTGKVRGLCFPVNILLLHARMMLNYPLIIFHHTQETHFRCGITLKIRLMMWRASFQTWKEGIFTLVRQCYSHASWIYWHLLSFWNNNNKNNKK